MAWAFELLSEAMTTAGRSKADVARLLGSSRPYITQLFSGQRNATLRTIAGLAWACDSRISLHLQSLRGGDFIDTPVRLVHRSQPRVVVQAGTEIHDSASPAPGALEPLVA